MIVTIDGPAGAGKSSVAKQLAQRLGFDFLDTGAMYRSVTLMAMRHEVALDDSNAIENLARGMEIRLDQGRVLVDGHDVSNDIRSAEVTRNICFVADMPNVRQVLNEKQRSLVESHDFVTEGRDQGTEVFPDAVCKIFLTASPQERARRRQRQLADVGRNVSVEQLVDEQTRRDQQDAKRNVGRLIAADDAVIISTDGMNQGQVVDQLHSLVQSRICETG